MDKIDRKPEKPKIKPFLIDKELKTKALRQTAVGSGKRITPKPESKPPDSLRQWASAFLLCLSIDIFVLPLQGFFGVRQSGSACEAAKPLMEALEAGSPLPLRRHHRMGYFNK